MTQLPKPLTTLRPLFCWDPAVFFLFLGHGHLSKRYCHPSYVPKPETQARVCVRAQPCLTATPWTEIYQAPLPMNFLGRNTGVHCHFLLHLDSSLLPFQLAASPGVSTSFILIPCHQLRPKEPFSSLPLNWSAHFLCYPFLIHSHNDLLNMFITSLWGLKWLCGFPLRYHPDQQLTSLPLTSCPSPLAHWALPTASFRFPEKTELYCLIASVSTHSLYRKCSPHHASLLDLFPFFG